MRFHFYFVSLVLVLVGCDGIEIAPCGWAGCGEGERCVNNACVPCGDSGETCCNNINGGEFCTASGYGCDPTDGPGTCSKDCGSVGKRCCDVGTNDACDAGSTCNVNEVCEAVGGDPCFSGSTPYSFTVVLADCGYVPQTFWTNTLAEAEACREQWLPLGPGEELCPVGVPPDSSHVCPDGESFGYDLYHCSAEQLAACEALYCSNCTWAACQ